MFATMKRSLILAVLFTASCAAQDVTTRMKEVVKSYTHSNAFMGSVLVARDGKILLNQGYGFANLEWKIPASPTTSYRLASITKQFTAASIMLLQERGKLKIQDPIRNYLPEAPAAWDKITIYNLLTHTSGIPNYTSFPDQASLDPFPITSKQLVTRFLNKPLDFQPGERYNYSNSGYAVLGYLIERLSGQSYGDFVEQNIFKPLGMTHSNYGSNSAIIPERASGYVSGPTGLLNAPFTHFSMSYAAGGLCSTTEDLLLWEQALFNGKFLSAASVQSMTTPFKNDYGFGLIIRTETGHKLIEHEGGVQGFNTQMTYYPEDKLTVIVLANLNGPAHEEIARKLAQIVHGEKVVLTSERKEVALSPQILATYIGTYHLASVNHDLVVSLEDGHLHLKSEGNYNRAMFSESESSFFLKEVDAQVDFTKDTAGHVTGLILHQDAHDMEGLRR
jgi:CubicO group peptidase (beta-lactamase class C family)